MASNSYFSHDSNARNSKKASRMRQRLIAAHGEIYAAAAYGVYWMLVERLREEENYVCEKDYDMLAFDFRVDPELIRTVVEDFGMFDVADDGRTFSSHGLQERMDEASKKSAAGKKGAESRWRSKNLQTTQEMAQDGTSMAETMRCQCDANAIKENKLNKNKENYSFSLSPSPSCEGVEEEKEKIVSFFTFQKNWASPCGEYEKLVAYNNRPEARKKWSQMSKREKESAVALWKQKDPKARFAPPVLDMWKKLYQILLDSGAPTQVRMAALDDGVSIGCDGGQLVLALPDALRGWIERDLDEFKPVIWPMVERMGCGSLKYRLIKPTNTQQLQL